MAKTAEKSAKSKINNDKKAKARKEKKPTDKLADKSGLTIFLQHVFGDAQKKTLRRMGKRVVNINNLAEKYADMSDEELQEQTEVLRKRIKKLLREDEAKYALEKVKSEKKDAKDSKKSKKAKKVEKASNYNDRNYDAHALDAVLEDAFAVVREASERVLKMRPFDVQLIGGIALHEGNVAEMKTGEGKTLVTPAGMVSSITSWVSLLVVLSMKLASCMTLSMLTRNTKMSASAILSHVLVRKHISAISPTVLITNLVSITSATTWSRTQTTCASAN